MSTDNNPTPCTHLTRRGRPCRNPATPGTNPPACRLHRPAAAPTQAALPFTDLEPPSAVARRFYLPALTAAEAQALADDPGANLQPEIALVRAILRRLAAYLDESAGELPPDEVRRLAGLAFAGARTVAHLLGHRAAAPDDDLRRWWADAADLVLAGADDDAGDAAVPPDRPR